MLRRSHLYNRKWSHTLLLRWDNGSTAGHARFSTSPKLDNVPSKIDVSPMSICCLGQSFIVASSVEKSVPTLVDKFASGLSSLHLGKLPGQVPEKRKKRFVLIQ